MQPLQNTGRKTIDRTSQHSLQVNRADTDLRFVHWSGVSVFAHIAKQNKCNIKRLESKPIDDAEIFQLIDSIWFSLSWISSSTIKCLCLWSNVHDRLASSNIRLGSQSEHHNVSFSTSEYLSFRALRTSHMSSHPLQFVIGHLVLINMIKMCLNGPRKHNTWWNCYVITVQ